MTIEFIEVFVIELGPIQRRSLDHMTKSGLVEAIRSFDFLDMENGPWIAGGAALHLARGIPELRQPSDIDFFFKTENSGTEARLLFSNSPGRSGVMKNNDHVANMSYIHQTFYKKRTYSIQFIKRQYYESLTKLFEDFDFTICMFATDGRHVYGPEQSWKDLDTKTLRLYGPQRKTIMRLGKYAMQGFMPEPHMMSKILAKPPEGMKYDPKFTVLSYPGGDEEY